MNSVVGAMLILALNLSIAASETEDNPATPAEQYAALLK